MAGQAAKAHPALLPGAIRVQLRQVDAQNIRHALRDVVLVFRGSDRSKHEKNHRKMWENGENDGEYPLVMSTIAIEAMATEIVDFPINNGGSFHSYVNVYQRGCENFRGKIDDMWENPWETIYNYMICEKIHGKLYITLYDM